MAGVLGEEHCPLAGRVGSSHDDHGLVLIEGGLGERGSVVDATAGQFLHAWYFQRAQRDPSRDDQGMAAKLGPPGAPNVTIWALHPDLFRFNGGEDLRPEALGLNSGSPGKIRSAEPLGKSEVVLNPGAGASLTARCLSLDHRRPQTFRGRVHGRSKAGRPAADNNKVIKSLAGFGLQADLFGQSPVVWFD